METRSSKLAEEYLRLGGRRRAAMDDNRVSTRLWDGEPEEAASFWEKHIAKLPEPSRKEVEKLLPQISGD